MPIGHAQIQQRGKYMSQKSKKQDVTDASKKEAEAIMKVAFIGRHIMNFACQCVAKNEDPRLVLETMASTPGFDSESIPVVALWRWINAPTPVNLKVLSVAFGFDIEKTAEKMKNEFDKRSVDTK
jgi:hypothetical protein